MFANFMQKGQIECPVCNRKKEFLSVWKNVSGTRYCACEECINSALPDISVDVDAVLRVGFAAGHNTAIQKIKEFFYLL